MLPSTRWTTLLLALAVLLSIGIGRSTAQTVIVERPPAVTYYAPPAVVAPAPVTVTTYRYGLLPRRSVTVRSYAVPAPAPVVVYEPRVGVRRPVRVVRYYTPVYPYP